MRAQTVVPRSREPWLKLKVSFPNSDKLGALPNDGARWGWVKVLAEAKTQRRMGLFASVKHTAELIGRHGRFVPNYVTEGLLHVAPALCDRCHEQYPDAKDAEVVVHDYRIEQRDPTNADRQADWRLTHSDVTPEVTAGVTESVTPEVTPFSRAQGTTVTVTETVKEENVGKRSLKPQAQAESQGSPTKEPRLTRDQLQSWESFHSPKWRPFKVAWLARGLLYPPAGSPDDDDTSQRGLLWQIAEGNPNRLGEWVAAAPGKTSREVINHVLIQFHVMRQEVAEEEADIGAITAIRRTDGPVRLGELLPLVVRS